MSLSARHSWIARAADRFGATASFLCALHCALLPLVIAVLPVLGLGFLADHRFERVVVVFAAGLALSSLLFGFRRHQSPRALWVLLPGVVLLLAGIVVDLDHTAFGHAVLVSAGGFLVALAHVVNLRLTHAHAHMHAEMHEGCCR